jgi:hypothetical protein
MLFLQKEYEQFTPKRLRDQILGSIDSYSYNAAAFIARELQKLGKLSSPVPDQIFTDNLLYIVK